jgi:hypothetical protein
MNIIRTRWPLFWATTLSPVVSAILGIYLSTLGQEVWKWSVWLGIFSIAFLSAYAAYRQYIKPVRDIAAFVDQVLQQLGEGILEVADLDAIEPRLNVLLIQHPWQKFFFPYLCCKWHLRMLRAPDVAIRFAAHKGVAGQVIRTKSTTLADLEDADTDWGFTPDELKRFGLENLTAVYSCPIYEIDDGGQQSGRVIGTVNMDAHAPGAADKIAAKLSQYEELLEDFSDLIAKLAS